MWCSFEKVCKLNPLSVDVKRIFSEQNQKIAEFLSKTPLIQNRDFSLSPDVFSGTNNNNNNNNIISSLNTNNFIQKNAEKANNPFSAFTSEKNFKQNEKSSTLQRGIQQILEESPHPDTYNLNFSKNNQNLSNSNNPLNSYNFAFNTTPVVAKDKDEFDLIQQLPHQKQNNVKNFISGGSSNISPNNLNFGNNFALNSSNEQSNFEIKHKLVDNSLIKPFTINSNSILSAEMTPNLQKVINRSNRIEKDNQLINNFNQGENNFPPQLINKNMFQNIQISGKIPCSAQQGNKASLSNSSLSNFKEYSNNQFKPLSNSLQTFTDISQLLRVFGEILVSFHLYNSKEAIEIIKSLPKCHYNTGYCLGLLGRCHFELSRYKEAEKFFQESFKLEPYRLEGLEYYSSCLWHLQDQYKLCHLANEALEQSYFAAETWIVFGNCYSLQKEHETALKFFNRAIQLNPSFSYAYTLSAHEYTETEAFSQAKIFYKDAIAYDDR